MSQDRCILIVAGEASGDAHAARLVAALRARRPQVRLVGIGGEALAQQGVNILVPASELAVVGFTEVLGRLPAVVRALREVGRVLRQERPALVILVDFPDFNFLVMRLAKRRGVPVMYYISPQVWAWRRYRVRTISRYVDRMVVIFPFEEDFYRQHGVPVTFVGHPFMETAPEVPRREVLLRDWGLDPDRFTLALLPGSRGSEIERHLPTMLAAARIVRQAIPEVQFILPLASTTPFEMVTGILEKSGFSRNEGGQLSTGETPVPPAHSRNLTSPCSGNIGSPASPAGTKSTARPLSPKRPVAQASHLCSFRFFNTSLKIIPGQAYQALSAAHLAMVASGTVTVEAALAGTPTVIIYKLDPLTFELGKRLIRVNYIGMANLLAEEGLFPELIQHDFTPAGLAAELLRWIRQPQRLAALGRGLARVVRRLGGPGASQRAAQAALALMEPNAGDKLL